MSLITRGGGESGGAGRDHPGSILRTGGGSGGAGSVAGREDRLVRLQRLVDRYRHLFRVTRMCPGCVMSIIFVPIQGMDIIQAVV